jgi:hypothetical protein
MQRGHRYALTAHPAPSLPPPLPGEGGEAAMNLCHVSLCAHAIKLGDSDLHRAGKRVYVKPDCRNERLRSFKLADASNESIFRSR